MLIIKNQSQLVAALAQLITAKKSKNLVEYENIMNAVKACPQWLKDGKEDPEIKTKSSVKFSRMTKAQEAEHKEQHQTNPILSKLFKESLPVKTKSQKFKKLLVDLFNTKTVLADVQPAIEEQLSAEIIKGDVLSQPVFDQIEITEASSVDDTALIRLTSAQISHKAEQDGTDPIQAQDGKPKYVRAVSQHSVLKSLHVISREAALDPKADILADILAGTDEETLEALSYELFAGIGGTGAEPELSGINTIKADLANSYAESIKSDATRDPQIFKVSLSGINGELGNPDPTLANNTIDNLIDLISSTPVKIKSKSRFYMESETLSEIMKLKDSSGELIFNKNKGLLLGYPVSEISGFRPSDGTNFVNANDIRVAFGLLSESIALKRVKSNVPELVVDEFSRDGALTLKGQRTFISYTKSNRCLRLLAAKAAI
jgi:HK97 family phage major capsid protein